MSYFSGNNIKLIAFEREDIDIVKGWINDERISVGNCPRFPICTYEQEMWYQDVYKDKTKKKMIISTKEGEKVGMVSLGRIDYKNQNSEIGIYIMPDHQQKGYAKEAISLLLRFSFNEMNMHKIYALICNYNKPSLELFKSLEFIHESTNKEIEFINGKFVDVEMFSIFKRNFSK